MKDQISIARIEQLHPDAKESFRSFVEECEQTFNITLRVTQGLRTIAEQDALYAIGRTKPGSKVTNAKGGSSFHNYGLAIDLVEMKGKDANWSFDYKKLVPIAEKYGLYWGGNFKSIKDEPHFEKSFGFKWRDLFERYMNKNFIPGTTYVKLK